MTKFIAIALIALCILTANAEIKKATTHFVDTKTVLAEIDKDSFGSTFISAIALSIATKSPIEEVMVLLDNIVATLTQEQSKADEKNRTDQATCDSTITGFKKQISEQTETIASLGHSIKENTEILAQAKIDLEQAEKDYDETIDAITAGTAQRQAEHSKWTEDDYQESIQIATLEEGVKLIQHMIHGVAFSQIKARYDKVLEKLSDTNSKRATLFKPLITSLTQLATKLNYENVMKILDLLNNIRAAIIGEQTTAKLAEEQAQADWEALLNHLENQKQSLADKKSRLGNLITSTEALLKQLKESLENHKVELENIQNSLASQVAWCNTQSATYVSESAERGREIEILGKLQTHITEKFKAVGDYIASRG